MVYTKIISALRIKETNKWVENGYRYDKHFNMFKG